MVCSGHQHRRCSHGQPGQNNFLIRSKPFCNILRPQTAVSALQYPESDVLSFAFACGTLINMYDPITTFIIHMGRGGKIHLRMGAVSMKHQYRSFCSWLIHQTAMQLEAILRPDKNIFCLLPVDPFDSLLDFLIILIPGCAFQCLPVCNIQLMSTADSRPESHISNYHPQQNNNCCHNDKYYPHLSLSIYSLLTLQEYPRTISTCIRSE